MLFGIRWGGLHTKIIAWSFVPTAIVLLAVALVAYSAYRNVTGDLVVARNGEVTRLSASQLATELDEYAAILSALARTPGMFAAGSAGQAAALKAASGRLAVFDAGVVVLNYRGHVVAAEPERPETLGHDWSRRAYFRQALSSPTPVFSDIVNDGPGGADVLVIAAPILGSQNELTGVLAGMFRLGASPGSAFYDSIIRLRIGGNDIAYLVDRAGRVIYHADQRRIGEDFSAQEAVQRAAGGEPGVFRTQAGGEQIVAGYAGVPHTSWSLVIEADWSRLWAATQGYGRFLIALLVLGVIAPAVVVAVGVRRITRPINELIQASQEVASGKLGRQIAARTGDELQALVEQFNRMSSRLQESYSALQEREERFALAMQGSNDGFWDWNVQTGAVYYSPRWKTMLGYAADDLPDYFDTWRDLLHPDDRQRALDAVQAYLRGRTPTFQLEHRLRHKDGSYRWILARGIALRDAAGQPYRMAGTHIDLTESKQAEHALRERIAFEELVSAISSEFVSLDPAEIDVGIRHALAALGRFTGADRSYVLLCLSDGLTLKQAHEWRAAGVTAQMSELEGASLAQYPYLAGKMRCCENMTLDRLADLPPEASAERREFERQGIRSLVCVPMVCRTLLTGFIGLDTMRAERVWGEDIIRLLTIVGEMFVNALERQRAQAIQAGQRQFLELLAAGGDFSTTLHTLVRIIEEQWPGMLGLILLLDPDGLHLHTGAAVSLPQEYVRSMEGLEIGPNAGSCGTACYRRERVVVEDIAADARWEGLRDLAQQHGLRACWSEPVMAAAGEVVGAFAMYYRQPRTPTEAELHTIETAAHLVSIAVEQRRAQQALQTAYQTLERRVAERTRELATLNALAAVVSRSLDLREILTAALDKVLEVAGLGCGGAYRIEGTGAEAREELYLHPLVYRGVSPEFARLAGRLRFAGSGVEIAAQTGAPHVWAPQTLPADPAMQEALQREGIAQVISIPLTAKGKLVGAIQVGTTEPRDFAAEELAFLAAIGQQVGLAVENARLYEQAEQSAAMTERNRLARELHDSVTQSLYSVTLYAEAAARLLTTGNAGQAAEHLRAVRDTAQEALREMRLLIFELRPPALEETGLAAALQARLKAVEARGGLQADMRVEGEEQLPLQLQQELYNIAREALNNAMKHAYAQHVRVRLQYRDDATVLEVTDDGAGFDLAAGQEGGGQGIAGMNERVQRIGGRLQIETAAGKGTRVTVEVDMPGT